MQKNILFVYGELVCRKGNGLSVMCRKPQRGSKDTALPSLNLGARWGWVVSVTLRPPYSRRRAPLQIVQEAGWAPGLFWTCVCVRKRVNLFPLPGF